MKKPSVGILAYGSLLEDPGSELKPLILEKRSVMTPFSVEYARSSTSRAKAPTLVPVANGGAQVIASILIVDANVKDATNMLYRREIHSSDLSKVYDPNKKRTPRSVTVRQVSGLGGVDVVIYAEMDATIANLSAENLAKLAIESCLKLDDGKDGISYLLNAKKHGIATPLSGEYEEEIKKQVGARNLEAALATMAAKRVGKDEA